MRPFLLCLLLTLVACCPALGQTTQEKINALTQPPLWVPDSVAFDAGGNPHTRSVTAAGDMAFASGNAFAGDTLRTWLATIDGLTFMIDPGASVSADSLYQVPSWVIAIPDSVLLEWTTGVHWENRLRALYPIEQYARVLFNH